MRSVIVPFAVLSLVVSCHCSESSVSSDSYTIKESFESFFETVDNSPSSLENPVVTGDRIVVYYPKFDFHGVSDSIAGRRDGKFSFFSCATGKSYVFEVSSVGLEVLECYVVNDESNCWGVISVYEPGDTICVVRGKIIETIDTNFIK